MGRRSANTRCGLEARSCPRCPRSRRCGFPRTIMMSLVPRLSTECASEVVDFKTKFVWRSTSFFLLFVLWTVCVVCLYAMYFRSSLSLCVALEDHLRVLIASFVFRLDLRLCLSSRFGVDALWRWLTTILVHLFCFCVSIHWVLCLILN